MAPVISIAVPNMKRVRLAWAIVATLLICVSFSLGYHLKGRRFQRRESVPTLASDRDGLTVFAIITDVQQGSSIGLKMGIVDDCPDYIRFRIGFHDYEVRFWDSNDELLSTLEGSAGISDDFRRGNRKHDSWSFRVTAPRGCQSISVLVHSCKLETPRVKLEVASH